LRSRSGVKGSEDPRLVCPLRWTAPPERTNQEPRTNPGLLVWRCSSRRGGWGQQEKVDYFHPRTFGLDSLRPFGAKNMLEKVRFEGYHMRRFVRCAAVIGLIAVSSDGANACAMVGTLNLDNVRYADIVVVGRLSNYRVHLEQRDSGTWRIGMVDLRIEQVLKGEAPESISVAIDDRGRGLSPRLTDGPQLVAIRIADSGSPRGPRSVWGQIIPITEVVSRFSVMEEPCEGPFILDAGSDDAITVVRSLKEAE